MVLLLVPMFSSVADDPNVPLPDCGDPSDCDVRKDKQGEYEVDTGQECKKWVTVTVNTWDCEQTLPDGSTAPGPEQFKVNLPGIIIEVREYGIAWCEKVSTDPYVTCDDTVTNYNIKTGQWCKTLDGLDDKDDWDFYGVEYNSLGCV